MKKSDKEEIAGIIDNEGFDYAFRHYSSFEEFEDKKFHELRLKYCEAAEKLGKYLGLEEY